MASDLEKKARDALIDDTFHLAIDLYNKAITEDPKNADLYADRAQAQFKFGNYNDDVADADLAIQLDASMGKAYMRKGKACFKLGNVCEAKTAFEKGAHLEPDDGRFSTRIEECHQLITLQQCAAAENDIATVDIYSSDSDEDTLTIEGPLEEWDLSGQKDVHFGPATPEIRRAMMDKLILAWHAIKQEKGSNSKKRLSWGERLRVLNEVVKYMAINHRAAGAVSHHDIELRVAAHSWQAREIVEILKKTRI